MARLGININCLDCKEQLFMPPNTKSEGDLIISIMQFNKCHNSCEESARAKEAADKMIAEKTAEIKATSKKKK